jgi:hypothetical protein
MAITSSGDLSDYLVRYPQEVAFGDEEPTAVLDRYHCPEFELWNDGLLLDRDRLLAHMRPARRNATAISTEVHQALVYGDRVAARYTLTATLRRGAVVATEIAAFGRLSPDGRLRRLDQLTRVVDHTLVATAMQ